MARFHLMKGRKRRASVTFHIDEDFSAGYRRRHAGRSLGLGRTFSTALTWIFALGTIYVSLHYVPAFLSPSQIVRVSDADEKMMSEERGPVMSVLGPYWDSLLARRSYIWRNESMEVQYLREGGTSLTLYVERCARKPVLEVFRCDVVSQQRIDITGKSGSRILTMGEPGFYQFREEYSGPMPRVIWRRA